MHTELNLLKTASKKAAHKASDVLVNKTTHVLTKSNDDIILKPGENPRNVEEIIITPEKRDEIINKLRKILQISKLLNNSTVKIVRKNVFK